MAKARTERLLNLLFVLLNTKHPVTREQIRVRVPGYEGSSDDAFERMFERDKEGLRQLNIPVVTKPVDIYHDDVLGYLIEKDSWLMPEIKLSRDERVLLSLAASAWNNAQISSSARKGAERISPAEVTDLPNQNFQLGSGREAIAELLKAISNQVSVQFTYQNANSDESVTRNVDPWKVILNAGHWYLIGFDLDRGESRSYRLDRMVGNPISTNQEIMEIPPTDLDPRQIVESWRAQESFESKSVDIAVLPGKAIELQLIATEIVCNDDLDQLTIPYLSESELARTLVRNCHNIVRIDSDSISNEVKRLITASLAVNKVG